ncbi:MAG: penicillin-binding protein activator [Magnetococcales bacterium]|nr:penicillin-binding protein activator [Magnetococcales bacterium]
MSILTLHRKSLYSASILWCLMGSAMAQELPAPHDWSALQDAYFISGNIDALPPLLQLLRQSHANQDPMRELLQTMAQMDESSLNFFLAQQPRGSLLLPFLHLSLGDLSADAGNRDQAMAHWHKAAADSSTPELVVAAVKRRLYPSTEQPVKIGLLLPLSGNNAAMGQSMLRAAQMAVSAYPDVPLLLHVADSRGEAAATRAAMEQLIQQGVDGFLGPVFHDAAMAAAQEAARSGRPLITFNPQKDVAAGTTVKAPILLNAFHSDQQGTTMARFAVSQRQARQIAIVAPASDYGRRISRAFTEEATQLGATVVRQLHIPDNSVDFSSTIKSLLGEPRQGAAALPFDALFLPLRADQVRLLIHQAVASGLQWSKILLLGNAQWHKPELLKDGNDYLMGAVFCDIDDGVRDRFQQRFQALWGQAPVQTTPLLAYDGVAIVAQALRDQRLGGPPWHHALFRQEGFRSVTGRIYFEEDGVARHTYPLFTIDKNGMVPLAVPSEEPDTNASPPVHPSEEELPSMKVTSGSNPDHDKRRVVTVPGR